MQHKQKELKAESRKLKALGVAALLTFVFPLSTVSAQECLNATGGNALGGGGSVSYSVGQVAYQTHTGTNGSVAEGVQQPYEISVVPGLEEAKGIKLSVMAYPNPTTDYLLLNIDASTTLNIQSMSYQLYDMNGKLLQYKILTDTETQIDMSSYVPATYFVRITMENKSIKEFKIIKQ